MRRWYTPLVFVFAAACVPPARAVEGQVVEVSADAVLLSTEGGAGEASRYPLPPVLAAQLRRGDRIAADLDEDRRVVRIQFRERAKLAPEPEPGLAVGELLPGQTIPGTDGPFHLGAGQGMPTVLAFFYTTCGIQSACPLLADKLRALQGEVGGAGRLVAITLDPDNDSLDALAAYAARQGVHAATWKLGRLELAALQALLDQLGIVRVPGDGQILHSQGLFLLDSEGRVAWRSETNTWEVAALGARLRALGTEPGRGE